MIEEVAAEKVRSASPYAPAVIGLSALFVLLLLAVHAGTPYLIKRATLQNEVATQVRTATGLQIATQHARFDLLPRPHVTMQGLHVSDPSGTLTIDADTLAGEVRLLPLIVGRIELSAATLVRPRLVIDLDGRPMQPDSTIGRAMHQGEAQASSSPQRLGSVTLVDGTADVRSRSLPNAASLSHVNLTVDWRDLDSPAALTGSLETQGTLADVAAWIAQPRNLMRGAPSAISARIHSIPLDLSASGDVVSAETSTFKGHVTASTPSLAALLAFGAVPFSLPASFADLSMAADMTASYDHAALSAIDLQNLHLTTDGNSYEGTLAFLGGPKPLISGTLAADQINLAPFLAKAPGVFDDRHAWSSTPLSQGHSKVAPPWATALDMRISATHLRVAPLTVDDAALSIMTRGDRTEVGLDGGKAYGGAIKGRVSFGRSVDGLSMRATGTLSDADAAALSWGLFGRQIAAGILSGSANLETSGDSPSSLVAHLAGWAKARGKDGEISEVDLGRALRAKQSGAPPTVYPALRNGRTLVSTMDMSLHIANGLATVEQAAMRGPDEVVQMRGQADLSTRTLDLHATASLPDAPSGPQLNFAVTGQLDKPALVVGSTTGAPRQP